MRDPAERFREILSQGKNTPGPGQDNSRILGELKHAKTGQRKPLIITMSLVVVVLLVSLALVFAPKGVTLHIEPQDAAEHAKIDLKGLAVEINGVVFSLAKGVAVTVSAPGFETATRSLAPDSEASTMLIAMQESPGRVSLHTDPAGPKTQWFIDGILAFTGESLETSLTPGEHAIKVENPAYQPAPLLVVAKRGELLEHTLHLVPLVGSLSLASTPDGANVVIDGQDVGKTPFQGSISGGEHSIEVRLATHRSVSEKVMVSADNLRIERNYRLDTLPGTLSFSVSPEGGVLLVDGQKTDPGSQKQVQAGKTILVSYQLPGHGKKADSVVLSPGESRSVSISLAAEFGKVTITSNVEGQVEVNGVAKGRTPLDLDLPALPQAITITEDGYTPTTRTVTPRSDAITQLKLDLISKADAAMNVAKKKQGTGANAAGLDLVLFQPAGDQFVMGAPRQEKGQRANEFQRRVRLTRPFLASRHEVTNAQFAKFKSGHSGEASLPAVNVSWESAAAFCNWLSGQEGLAPFYKVDGGRVRGFNAKSTGYRLPTEAEWEWLARKANRKVQTVFPWGDQDVIPEGAGNIADESAQGKTRFFVPGYNDNYAGLANVGSFKAEASGLHDLTGNAAEWVHDFYSWDVPKAGEVFEDPLGENDGDGHVVKGSSWRSGTRTPLRAAYRENASAGRDDLGFRVARYCSE